MKIIQPSPEDTMHHSLSFPRPVLMSFTAVFAIGAALPESAQAQQRPMTHLDVRLMRRAGAMAISVDGGSWGAAPCR